MKKIVLLSERFPYPPTSGTKNLLYNYCRILHNELGLDVIRSKTMLPLKNPILLLIPMCYRTHLAGQKLGI